MPAIVPVFAFDGKKYAGPQDFDQGMLMPYSKFLPLLTDASALAMPRAVFADIAGTADIVDAYGNACVGFPLVKGENKIMLHSITNLVGTTKVWGAY